MSFNSNHELHQRKTKKKIQKESAIVLWILMDRLADLHEKINTQSAKWKQSLRLWLRMRTRKPMAEWKRGAMNSASFAIELLYYSRFTKYKWFALVFSSFSLTLSIQIFRRIYFHSIFGELWSTAIQLLIEAIFRMTEFSNRIELKLKQLCDNRFHCRMNTTGKNFFFFCF